MLIASTETIQGKEITETLGVVRGNTVRARGFGKDFTAGLKNLVGGEISEYSGLLTESRNQAVARMLKEAEELGADAVVGVRFTTSSVMQGMAEILAFGTAVKLK